MAVARDDSALGIIPAYAGNTLTHGRGGASFRDHPRVCGEHGRTFELAVDRVGSSPRMRGTPYHPTSSFSSPGIIPAYAGNTKPAEDRPTYLRDHPRVCGEHTVFGHGVSFLWGSSPRMRGTPAPRGRSSQATRIIPAYAGNTTF